LQKAKCLEYEPICALARFKAFIWKVGSGPHQHDKQDPDPHQRIQAENKEFTLEDDGSTE
jgi:hypothetical protein